MPELNDDDLPQYRLLKAFFGPDHCLWPEDAELEFDGTPNEWMEPLNEMARKRMMQFQNEMDYGRWRKACKDAVEKHLVAPTLEDFMGAPRPDLADQVYEAMKDRPREMPTKVDAPMMPHMATEEQKRRRGRPPIHIKATVPDVNTGRPGRPKRIMGSLVSDATPAADYPVSGE